MTRVLPVSNRSFTVADYVALGDAESLRWSELQEGTLIMSPTPALRHQLASGELFVRLRGQLPGHLVAVSHVDVDLRLASPDRPGTVRAPDLVVVTRPEIDRVGRDGGILHSDGVVLAVEILSPGNPRTDRLVKRAEYADAGIPHYWIVDLDAGPSLTACSLVDGTYRDTGPLTGQVDLDAPFPLRLDLPALG